MVRLIVRIFVAAAVLSAGRQIYLWGCQWTSAEIVTTFARHPDLPRPQYVAGKLGVLLPSYATSYQVIAYRYMNGIGMTAGEQSQANLYFQDRQVWSQWDRTAPDWGKEWQKAIASVAVKRKVIVEPERYNETTLSYELNCADDAFRVATFTLRDRLKRVGALSPFFVNWLEGQQAVFTNCAGAKGDALPAMPPGSPQWLRQDRAYQQGAWFFYRGDEEAAIRAFRAVAADAGSQWKYLARYLVVRAMTRGTQRDVKEFPRAAREIDAILRDPKLAQIHSAVKVLRRRNVLIGEPEQALSELSSTLIGSGIDLSLRQDLWDFVFLYDTVERSAVTRKMVRKQDLSDWLSSIQRPEAESAAHARERWRKTRSVAWLVAAISWSVAGDEGVEELLEAASLVPDTQPAYQTLAYHRARIYCERKQYEEARKIVDPIYGMKGIGMSTRNLFAMLRAQSMADLSGFLRALPRQPVLLHYDIDEGEVNTNFDRYFAKELQGLAKSSFLGFTEAKMLNEQAPLKLLAELALGEDLPGGLSIELRRVALMRSLLLERSEFYRPLAGVLGKSFPSYKTRIDSALRKQDDSAVRDSLLRFTIQQPEIRPYFLSSGGEWFKAGKLMDSRDNFWPEVKAGDPLSFEQQGGWAKCEEKGNGSGRLNYLLVDGVAKEADSEFEQLRKIGSAGTFYMNHALGYYEAHSKEAGIDNLLGGAVRVWNNSRRSEKDMTHAALVWRILQLKYPKSPWATRYHAGVMGPTYEDPEIKNVVTSSRNLFPGVRCRFQPWD